MLQKRALTKKKSPQPALRSKPSAFNRSVKASEKSRVASASTHSSYENLGELPEAYGTKKLFLICRDPEWAFVYWDFTWQQIQDALRNSQDTRIYLQVYSEQGDLLQQIQIFEGTRNWYLHLNSGCTSFYAELGFYSKKNHFEAISRSGLIHVPRNRSSSQESRFVTIPSDFSFAALRELIQSQMEAGEGLAGALARLQAEGFEFPFSIGKGRKLTDAELEELLRYLGDGDLIRKIRMGSEEITEMLRRRVQQMQSSGQWESSGSVTSLSSPFGGASRQFFMHVNAELIVYGGTDPKAQVRVNGQKIQLREDGTFSYHFALPDGNFFIPVEATSPDGVEERSAMLSFHRLSDYVGHVEKTGQPPLPEPLGRIL